MYLNLLAALVSFAFVMSVTPGPNVMLVMASGVNYGFRATIPHMLGICVGFSVMLLAVGFGVGQLFALFPALSDVLKIVSIAYLLWLAWKVASAAPKSAGDIAVDARPMTFLEGAAFQWVNPKAWTICLTSVAAYTVPASFLPTMLIMTAVFLAVNALSLALWTGFGVSLRRVLQDPRRVRVFNVVMGLLLAASLIPLLLDRGH